MPVSPGYTLTAAACPALVTPTGIHDPLVDTPLLNPTIAAGPSAPLIAYSEQSGVALEDAFRYGGGAYAIAAGAGNGLALADGGGLICNVQTGVALLDWPVVRSAIFPLTLTDGVRNFIWLPSSGTPTKVSTSLTPPTASCVCLGAVDCAAGSITLIDYAPRFELRNGTLWRKTADAGMPGDTPGASLTFLTRTAGGLYLWDGIGYLPVGPAQVANAQVTPGQPVLHRIDIAAGATGDVDTVLTFKTRIVDVWLVKRNGAGGGAGTIQIKNGASAITDAMSINVADQTIIRPTTIDDATYEIAAAGTLRVTRTRTASTDETCTAYILGVLVV